MTYIGTPPEVLLHRPVARSHADLRRQEVVRAQDEAEGLELMYYEASAKWAHALQSCLQAQRKHDQSAIRRLRYELELADAVVFQAQVAWSDARRKLIALLEEKAPSPEAGW